MALRPAPMLLSVFGWAIVFTGAAALGKQAEHGPRLSDAELLQVINLEYPGLEAVAKAVAEGSRKTALEALAKFFRDRKEPYDFFQSYRNPSRIYASADDVLMHRLTVVNILHTFPGAVDWHFNPTTVPDSKYPRDNEWTWQLNRHAEFGTLARAYRATGDEKYAREFARLLESWLRQCPVPVEGTPATRVTAWRPIEAGIRPSRNWAAALTAFRASPSVSDRLLLDWLKSWIEHGRYLYEHPSRGNHLTMEMNGLYHVGTLIPFAKDADIWRAAAAECLRKEMELQVYPDGAQIELAPNYHNVALRNMLAIYPVARAYGQKLPDDYPAGLEKMFAYEMWAMQPDRDLPHWNDSDRVNVSEMLRQGAELFPHRQDFLWIATAGERGTPPDHTSHYFPWAGQVIMRSGWDREALFLGFEVGPYGAGHQHEDKLSVVIVATHPLLVESGNYEYDASSWRRYALSSQAHNLVLVDGGGQDRKNHPETKLAKNPLDADFQTNEKFDFARGIYDEGFEKGIRCRHTREVLYDKANKLFAIRDRLAALDGNEHLYEALWHLDAPRLLCEPKKGVYETQIEGGPNLRLVAQTGTGLECRVVEGQEKPVVQGWMPLASPRRGVRPSPCVICGRKGECVEFLTVFQPLPRGNNLRVIAAAFQNGSLEVSWSDSHKTKHPWPN